LETENTAYKNRFDSDFTGPLIPFGAEVTYLPITHQDKSEQHAFGSKMRRGIFLGYVQQAGGGWSGDLLVADWEEVAGAQSFSEIHLKRFNHKEVSPTKNGETFIFPVADGSLRQPGADHLTSPHSDPFDRAGATQARRTPTTTKEIRSKTQTLLRKMSHSRRQILIPTLARRRRNRNLQNQFFGVSMGKH